MSTTTQPHELLEDGLARPGCDLLVVGCGNLLRGDDAVGPLAIRTLWSRGVPDGVRLVDGGTAGMDVAFQMRGARRVIIIDASRTGAPPGTVVGVPGEWLLEALELADVHPHAFRWDHALAFAKWLLGPGLPAHIDIYLIEAETTEHGAPLSAVVRAAMERVVDLVVDEYPAAAAPLPAVDRTAGRHTPQAVCAPDRTRGADHRATRSAGGAAAAVDAGGRRLGPRAAS